jgi:hypothetical protein
MKTYNCARTRRRNPYSVEGVNLAQARIYRLSEAAAVLSCSVDSLRRWEQEGVVMYARVCGQRVLTERDFAIIREHRAKVRQSRTKPTKVAVGVQG